MIVCTGAEAIALILENNLAKSLNDIANQLSDDNFKVDRILIGDIYHGNRRGRSKSTRQVSEHIAMRIFELYDIWVTDRIYFNERKR